VGTGLCRVENKGSFEPVRDFSGVHNGGKGRITGSSRSRCAQKSLSVKAPLQIGGEKDLSTKKKKEEERDCHKKKKRLLWSRMLRFCKNSKVGRSPRQYLPHN